MVSRHIRNIAFVKIEPISWSVLMISADVPMILCAHPSELFTEETIDKEKNQRRTIDKEENLEETRPYEELKLEPRENYWSVCLST